MLFVFWFLKRSTKKIRINLLTVLYLIYLPKKIIEKTFKRGFLGIEYYDRFPKLIEDKN